MPDQQPNDAADESSDGIQPGEPAAVLQGLVPTSRDGEDDDIASESAPAIASGPSPNRPRAAPESADSEAAREVIARASGDDAEPDRPSD